MMEQEIYLELLSGENIDQVRAIDRADVSETFVDGADTIMELTQYGLTHGCIGHTYAIRCGDKYIGVILLGEAIEWETDPEEMRGVPFYRTLLQMEPAYVNVFAPYWYFNVTDPDGNVLEVTGRYE